MGWSSSVKIVFVPSAESTVELSTGSSARFTFLGCYTKGAGGEGEGIVRVHWDSQTGALIGPAMVAATPSPSFLVRHPELPMLYAANELHDGTVSAFLVTSDGALNPLGTWPSGGSFPCHLNIDTSGRHLLIANYGSGTVTAHALDENGVPTGRSDTAAHSGHGKHPERQEGPHAHSVAAASDGVLAVDLGVDTVFFYRLDAATGRLGEREVAFRTRPGTGPRHLVWDRSGRLHLVGELDASIATYEPGPDGWRELSRVPASVDESAMPSEIALSGDGRFLYVANRGPDTISTFSLATAVPRFVGEVATGGAWPRHFAINGAFLAVANQGSDSVVTFRLDHMTGLPNPTGDILATRTPACVLPW
jgi:6-phosphogluconolactonase